MLFRIYMMQLHYLITNITKFEGRIQKIEFLLFPANILKINEWKFC